MSFVVGVMKKIQFLFLIILFPLTAAAQGLDTLHLKTIFYPPFIAGTRPDFQSFSANNHFVYFYWNDSSYADRSLYEVSLKGGTADRVENTYLANTILSPDKKHLAFVHDGDLWISDQAGGHRRKIISTNEKEENPVWSPDSKSIAYTSNGNVWIVGIVHPGVQQLTDKPDSTADYDIVGWADNGHKLILQQNDDDSLKTYYFPEYLHKYVKPGAEDRGIPVASISELDIESREIHRLLGGKIYFRNIDISPSGRYLAVDRVDAPMKHRDILVYDTKADTSYTVFQDSTKGWIVWDITEMKFAPHSDRLMFTSEKTGYNEIYLVDHDGSNLKEITFGNYEIPWAGWINDHNIVYASTKTDPVERHLYELDLKKNRTKELTPETAYRRNFKISPDHRFLVYKKTYWNQPADLYALDLKHPRDEVQLTHTVPDRFSKINWQKPEYHRFTGRDGRTRISMTILKPVHLVPGKKYPVIVFVHGAGSIQNVYKGWSYYYYREYMFNQYLAEHGFVVIQVDYRHSTGYGRKFREDVEGWLGHYETQDIEDALRQLKNTGYADLNRVGIYGGSYGGFLSLYTIEVAPNVFKAAAALRAVTNWRNYYYTNPWYTYPRLGTPKQSPENYKRSSPLTYADSLKRPVLILHGLRDNNVGFQDAAQFIHALIKSGNHNFQFMMYPGERHSFEQAYDWYDEYTRIYKFFVKNLADNNKTVTQGTANGKPEAVHQH